jgi:archaellum component FlaC|uniref:Chromosome segregation protein n=1 Tax=Siphoviridae sp. ctSA812 TaxID=2825508 RepID=A0A8S5U3C2_9CAUD|nr:MAG TPA: chromosome segregation protein [Siphoviridae sp. ctSA812]
MNRFYIDKLTVSGGGHKTTVIDFKPGLNFILGPSNTGKSLVMDCLDYAFGFTPKKNRPSKIVDNNYGYERIALHLVTANGTVILERKIGDTKISVSGTDPTVDHGTYSVGHKAKKNINAVYLHLLGIDEVHSVRSAEKGAKTQDLTWRSMLHLFFIRQADVARESSALLAPGSVGHTASAAVLLYLLTGQDANDLAADEDPKISEAKKKALIGYIQEKVDEFSRRREALEETLSSSNIKDPRSSVEQVRKEIAELQAQVDEATRESQQLMSQIYEWNGKLSESRTVGHNFAVLRQQYQSDIRRIGFIVDGAATVSPVRKKVKCPICGEETERVQDTSFIDASAAELEKIKRHLSELSDAQHSVEHQQETIIATIRTLEEKKKTIDTLISEQLQPRLSVFEEELEQQLSLIRLTSELEIVRQNETQYRSELFNKETEEASEPSKHNIYEDYDYDIIHGFEEKLREILQASKIGGAASARLNMENFDIEIGGFKKSVSMGGGFCGILNTITTLAMSGYLIDLDRNAPGFYAVDSSLTQLSEAEHKEQSDTIKQNFIEYLISHAHERQVIIVEQTKRMPFVPDESDENGIHVIKFSRNKEEGRYGFLNEVYNPEDQ